MYTCVVVWVRKFGVRNENYWPQLDVILPLRVSSCNCTVSQLQLSSVGSKLSSSVLGTFFTQSGVCGCEKGYTEVMTSHGFLDYCTRTPGVDHSKKADVKTNSGRLKPRPSQANDLFSEWTLRPVGPGIEMEIIFIDQSAWMTLFMVLKIPVFVHLTKGRIYSRSMSLQSKLLKSLGKATMWKSWLLPCYLLQYLVKILNLLELFNTVTLQPQDNWYFIGILFW